MGVDGVKAAGGDSEVRLRGQAEKCGGTPPDPDLSEAETSCCGARGVTGRHSLCFWKPPKAAREGSGQISSHRLLLSQKALHLPKLIRTKAFGGAPQTPLLGLLGSA